MKILVPRQKNSFFSFKSYFWYLLIIAIDVESIEIQQHSQTKYTNLRMVSVYK